MSENYRKELVQVAAVAQAMAQLADCGSTALDATNHGVSGRWSREKFLSDIRDERHRQEARWGTRTPLDTPADLWLLILMEEVGEVAEEVNDREPERVQLIDDMIELGRRARAVLERK